MAEVRLRERVFLAGGSASTCVARAFARVLFAGASCGTWANVVDLRRRFFRRGGGATHTGVFTLGADGVSFVNVGASAGALSCGAINRVICLLVVSFKLSNLGTNAVALIVFSIVVCFVAVGAVASTSCWSSLISCLAVAFGIPLTILVHSAKAFMTLS